MVVRVLVRRRLSFCGSPRRLLKRARSDVMDVGLTRCPCSHDPKWNREGSAIQHAVAMTVWEDEDSKRAASRER